MLQTGYLTIQHYNEEDRTYTLGYPNAEVRNSFYKYLIAAIAHSNPQDVEQLLFQLKKSLDQNNIDTFCTLLTSLLAHIPYHLRINTEGHYHALLQFLVSLIGIKGESEISSDKGRIDMVISTKNRIVIFEFKFNSTGQEALTQIINRRYYEKYRYQKKPITLVGLSFNIQDKTLSLDWVKKDL